MDLRQEYEITIFEAYLSKVVHFFKRKKRRLPKLIIKMSQKRYGKRNNLLRYYIHEYLGVPIGKYSYGFETFLKLHHLLESVGSFCSIAGNVSIANGNHPTYFVTTHPITYNPEHGMVDKYIDEIWSVPKVVIKTQRYSAITDKSTMQDLASK